MKMNMGQKDLRIMEMLAMNCRIPHTTVAQAINVSKDTAAYRIRRLEEEGYIRQYVLFIDARRLGFTRYHLLVKLDPDAGEKEVICRSLAAHGSVMWINSFIGRYDLQIIVDASDGFELNRIREELFALCGNKVKEYLILTHLYDLEFTQLNPLLDLKTKFQKKDDHSFSSLLSARNFPVGPGFERYGPKKEDSGILRELADDPRASLIDIGRKLSVDRATVKKRIMDLIKKKVILSFGAIPDLSKQGFVTYYLLVRLEQETPLDVLRKPFARLQNIFYAGKMLGSYDMILYLNARNPQELNESIRLFTSDIGSYLVHYDLLVQDKVHHWRQFTDGIYESLMPGRSREVPVPTPK